MDDAIKFISFLFPDNFVNELLPLPTLKKIEYLQSNNLALVIFGQDHKAKAKFINNLLSFDVLPVIKGHWRWLRFQYSKTSSAHFSNNVEHDIIKNIKVNDKVIYNNFNTIKFNILIFLSL